MRTVAEKGRGAEPEVPGSTAQAADRPDADAPALSDDVRSVALVAVAVVGIVLAVAAVGTFLPPVEALFFRVPVAIVVLVVGTAWVLWRVARRPAGR